MKKSHTKIIISDLQLRAIIGTNEWEREAKQDILINITLTYDAAKAIQTDDLQHAANYKSLTKKIIDQVEASQFYLLEKLTAFVLNIIMQDPRVLAAVVRIDKPQALRFSRSVAVEMSAQRSK